MFWIKIAYTTDFWRTQSIFSSSPPLWLVTVTATSAITSIYVSAAAGAGGLKILSKVVSHSQSSCTWFLQPGIWNLENQDGSICTHHTYFNSDDWKLANTFLWLWFYLNFWVNCSCTHKSFSTFFLLLSLVKCKFIYYRALNKTMSIRTKWCLAQHDITILLCIVFIL